MPVSLQITLRPQPWQATGPRRISQPRAPPAASHLDGVVTDPDPHPIVGFLETQSGAEQTGDKEFTFRSSDLFEILRAFAGMR